jgi:hypothetical protein
MNRTHITTALEIVGGFLIVGGVSIWNIPAALITAGVLLIVAGGVSA